MKRTISILMVLMLTLYVLLSFADKGPVLKTTSNDDFVKNERITAINNQVALMDLELKKHKDALISLTGSDALEGTVKVSWDDSINKSDDDDDNDEEGKSDDDDDDSVDTPSGATTVNLKADQLTVVNSLRTQIKDLLLAKEALLKELKTEETTSGSVIVNNLETQNPSVLNLKKLGVNSVFLKGTSFKFDVPPVIKEGRTLVPLRALAEGMGAVVQWDPITQKVTVVYEGKTLVFQLGDKNAWINGKQATMEVAAESMDSRTMVPIRFIAEVLGLKVSWHPGEQTIELVKGTIAPLPVVTTVPATTVPVIKVPTTTRIPATTPPADAVSGATVKKK